MFLVMFTSRPIIALCVYRDDDDDGYDDDGDDGDDSDDDDDDKSSLVTVSRAGFILRGGRRAGSDSLSLSLWCSAMMSCKVP